VDRVSNPHYTSSVLSSAGPEADYAMDGSHPPHVVCSAFIAAAITNSKHHLRAFCALENRLFLCTIKRRSIRNCDQINSYLRMLCSARYGVSPRLVGLCWRRRGLHVYSITSDLFHVNLPATEIRKLTADDLSPRR